MSEREPRHPFRGELVDKKSADKNYEARIRELEGRGFIIKEVSVKDENAFEVAKERYKQSIELLQQNGFSEFLPDTFVIVGEGSKGPSVYIAQEKIQGKHYDEIINLKTTREIVSYYEKKLAEHTSQPKGEGKVKINFSEYPNREILEQEDLLTLRALELWEKTRNLSEEEKKKLPQATAFGRKRRKPQGTEGIMPEIMNPINMMFGRRIGKDTTDKLFLVDIGLVAPEADLIFSSRLPGNEMNDTQRNLENSLPATIFTKMKKKLLAMSDEETYKEFEKIFPTRSGALYEDLRKKYTNA